MSLRIHRIFDVTILLIALGAVFAIIYYIEIPPAKRGFICNDPAISYPYKRNSVSTKFVLVHMQLILIFVIILTEFLLIKVKNKEQVLNSFRRSLKWIMDYLFTWSMMNIPFMFVKKLAGVLRPHFLELCKPNVTDCISGTLVTQFHCTNENLSVKKSELIMQSFPSGHSALAVYFSVFLIFYFQKRISVKSQLFTPLLQGILLFWMSYVSASRVYDNYHHGIDVIFGVIIGAVLAIFTIIFMCKKFEDNLETKTENGLEIPLENISK